MVEKREPKPMEISRFTAKPTARSLWLLFRRSEAGHPAQQHALLREAKLIRQESALSRSDAASCTTGSETGFPKFQAASMGRGSRSASLYSSVITLKRTS
jgi:hypothetical protein